jgi:triacylglycerol lipase
MPNTTFDQKAFKYSTTLYTPENALTLARVAKAVYQKQGDGAPAEASILGDLQQLDAEFTKVIGFSQKSAQGCVIVNKKYVVAAFRGTDEGGDWLDNLNAVPRDGPFGQVHTGFQKSLMDIWPDMKSAIRLARRDFNQAREAAGLQPGSLPLWITGHSLGGAMATLAGAELIQADEPFYGIYTFGAPRTGDRDFARIFNVEAGKRTFRFQNNNDIVTRVPSRVMGYSHIGSFVYITADKKLTTDAGFWFQFLDRVKGTVNAFGDKGLDLIEGHSMDDYIRGIQEYGDKLPEA